MAGLGIEDLNIGSQGLFLDEDISFGFAEGGESDVEIVFFAPYVSTQ